jgi:hypothetical protein
VVRSERFHEAEARRDRSILAGEHVFFLDFKKIHFRLFLPFFAVFSVSKIDDSFKNVSE